MRIVDLIAVSEGEAAIRIEHQYGRLRPLKEVNAPRAVDCDLARQAGCEAIGWRCPEAFHRIAAIAEKDHHHVHRTMPAVRFYNPNFG
jgi:hypothetical protein